ncbi:uncharacterized protein DUF397 [Saccharothrix saharensis]|uniref:Uncharacterized protein DUF397 n=1 Tax=Saccharothrix saharensis TaxID=571190 RepID=A0A543JFT9_9PSEU|nr:DUF397 domain-containing protein [Saccharothrix saharensis]TQM81705.1 uncharacterized protein DUF397 [Saccharothrix saharensis]
MTTSVRWVKSSYSMENGSCVEVAVTDTVTGVRDSKNADGPVLTFPTHRWAAFLARTS